MRLVFHGGRCCGIKTIILETRHPTTTLPNEVSTHNNILTHDMHGEDVSSDLSFFTKEAPKETAEARFVRLVDFCRKHRPSGIIEVTLAFSGGHHLDYSSWVPVLLKHGFKESCRAFNSNSGNTVAVYHLCYGKEPIYTEKTEKKDF